MSKEQISEIVVSSNLLSENLTSLIDELASIRDENGDAFKLNENIPGSKSSPALWLTQVSTASEIIGKFEASAHHSMVPQARLTNLKTRLDEANKHVNNLQSNLVELIKNNGGLKVFDYENFQMTTGNNQTHNVQKLFVNLNNSIEGLLEAFYQALAVLRPSKATYSFQAAASAFKKLIEKVQSQSDEIHKEAKKINQTLVEAHEAKTEIEEVKDSVYSTSQEAKRLTEEVSTDRKTVTEHLSDVTDKSASVSSIHEQAIELENAVKSYNEKFTSFEQQLNERERVFQDGTEKLSELIKSFENQREDVLDLITKSEDMLKGATVAGLAGRFEEIRRELTDELQSARRSFYWGIFFLFISAIPLLAFVFMPIVAPVLEPEFPGISEALKASGAGSSATGWQYVGQVLARFIILLPAAWFASFAAVRHSSLFRLREHYSYKYSMAVSVEGFKKQAEGYENEIAAMILEQLAFNPADKLVPSKDIKEGKAPLPMMSFFVSKFQKKIKQESGDQ